MVINQFENRAFGNGAINNTMTALKVDNQQTMNTFQAQILPCLRVRYKSPILTETPLSTPIPSTFLQNLFTIQTRAKFKNSPIFCIIAKGQLFGLAIQYRRITKKINWVKNQITGRPRENSSVFHKQNITAYTHSPTFKSKIYQNESKRHLFTTFSSKIEDDSKLIQWSWESNQIEFNTQTSIIQKIFQIDLG